MRFSSAQNTLCSKPWKVSKSRYRLGVDHSASPKFHKIHHASWKYRTASRQIINFTRRCSSFTTHGNEWQCIRHQRGSTDTIITRPTGSSATNSDASESHLSRNIGWHSSSTDRNTPLATNTFAFMHTESCGIPHEKTETHQRERTLAGKLLF